MIGSLGADIFENRRKQLAALLNGTPLILVAPPPVRRNNDVFYPYRPDSSFRYLTGFLEPDAVAVVTAEGRFILFVRPRDPKIELWDGTRAGPEGALAHWGADEAYPYSEIEVVLKPQLAKAERLAFHHNPDSHLSNRIHGMLETIARERSDHRGPSEIVRPGVFLDPLRFIKTEADLSLYRSASQVTRDAHVALFRHTHAGEFEYQLEARLNQTFRNAGGDWAYPPIVATGANACVLHYINNDAQLIDGQVVLVDAGAEMEGCAADVTRCFPVGTHFEGPARDLYTLCLEAQLKCLDEAVAGCTLQGLHQTAARVITAGLIDLSILDGDVDERVADDSFKPYFPHGLGHFLGMDVHDVGTRVRDDGTPRPLPAGTCITIEPGIYIQPGDSGADERFHGIGIRIEDNVVLQQGGHENLSAEIPKAIDDIEALRREATP